MSGDVVEAGGTLAALLYPRAVSLARNGQYAEAERLLGRLIEQEPLAEFYLLLGRVRAQRGDHQGAALAFEDAARVDPSDVAAAAALERVRRMSKPLGALGFWAPRGLAAGLAVALVVVMAMSWNGPTSAAPGPAAEALVGEPVVAAPPAPADPAGVPVSTEAFVQFADVRERVDALELRDALILTPAYAGGALSVSIDGAVPTETLRTEVRRQLAALASIDMAGVDVTGRYAVREGDTLVSIASFVYADGSRWPEIWRANEGLVIDPGLIQVGWTLTVP